MNNEMVRFVDPVTAAHLWLVSSSRGPSLPEHSQEILSCKAESQENSGDHHGRHILPLPSKSEFFFPKGKCTRGWEAKSIQMPTEYSVGSSEWDYYSEDATFQFCQLEQST